MFIVCIMFLMLIIDPMLKIEEEQKNLYPYCNNIFNVYDVLMILMFMKWVYNVTRAKTDFPLPFSHSRST